MLRAWQSDVLRHLVSPNLLRHLTSFLITNMYIIRVTMACQTMSANFWYRVNLQSSKLGKVCQAFSLMSRLHAASPVVSGNYGLLQVSQIGFEKDFCFDVRGKEYFCCRFVACYVSRRVARLFAYDASFNRFFVDVDDPSGMFDRILQLANGGNIDLSANDVDLAGLLRLSLYIENDELIRSILDIKWPTTEICVENVINRIEAKLRENLPVDDEASFISCHFDDVCSHLSNDGTSNLLARLGYDVSSKVLCDSQFESTDHDRLTDMILCSGKPFLPLLECVKLEQCNTKTLQNVINEVSAGDVCSGIWRAVANRLRLPIILVSPKPQ